MTLNKELLCTMSWTSLPVLWMCHPYKKKIYIRDRTRETIQYSTAKLAQPWPDMKVSLRRDTARETRVWTGWTMLNPQFQIQCSHVCQTCPPQVSNVLHAGVKRGVTRPLPDVHLPEWWPEMSDVYPLSGISWLSLDSPSISPLQFFCLVLLLFVLRFFC